MLIYVLYYQGEVWLKTSDHAYACEWVDHWGRKLGALQGAGWAEAQILTH